MYDEIITRESADFKSLMRKIGSATDSIRETAKELKPTICNERYLSGKEVCEIFHITKRTLQEYRDQFLIPYTRLGNKIYYSESAINNILRNNHVDARENWTINKETSLL